MTCQLQLKTPIDLLLDVLIYQNIYNGGLTKGEGVRRDSSRKAFGMAAIRRDKSV